MGGYYKDNTRIEKFFLHKIIYPIVNKIGLTRKANLWRHKIGMYSELSNGRCEWCGEDHRISLLRNYKENDADKGIVHFGGESKEEIEAEDRWHDEQMTNTEKILAEFYETKSFIVPNGGDIRKVEISYEDWLWIENFFSTAITQALAEDRERIIEKIEKWEDSYGFYVGAGAGQKNELTRKTRLEILNVIQDKPLTNNKDI